MNKLLPIALLCVMILLLFTAWSNILHYNDSVSEEYNTHIENAEKLMSKEIYIDAVGEYEAALKLQPNDYELAMKIVDLYGDLDMSSMYVKACRNAISADKSQIDPYLVLADYYMDTSSFQNAYSILHEADGVIPDNEEIIKRIVEIKKTYSEITVGYDVVGELYYYDGIDAYYSRVLHENLYGLISTSASLIFECEYEDIGLMADDLMPVKKNGEYYYVNEDWYRKLVPDENADYLGSFGDGFAPASFGGVYGYIDSSLEQYNFEYDYAGGFANGIAAVKKGDKWAIINNSFENVTDFEFSDILLDDYGFCSKYGVFFAKKGSQYNLYDCEGTQLAGGFEDAKLFVSEEPAAIKQNGKWGFVSNKGDIVIEPRYKDAKSFSIGYAPFLEDNLWGCIDDSGNVLIEPMFNELSSFSENGYAISKKDNVCKYIVVNLYDE